ncbi:hypothetical protein QLX08_001612 [Tetragonisca angustula]|uniref:RRM domain-containing protein n=1 Tax=Tetragonisca angustula TaxID=166442 RepID=A0AAW1AEB4_9HYME
MTDDRLKEMFEKYGTITSHKVMIKDDGKSGIFGFVAFEDPDAAEQVVLKLNEKEAAEGKCAYMYVGLAQTKAERQQELKRKFEQLKLVRLNRYQGVNPRVKNLDDSVDDLLEQLRLLKL